MRGIISNLGYEERILSIYLSMPTGYISYLPIWNTYTNLDKPTILACLPL